LGIAAAPGEYGTPRLAPRGSTVAIEKSGSGNQREIWLLSETHQSKISGSERYSPVWASDGSAIVCASTQGGMNHLFSIDAKSAVQPWAPFGNNDAKRPTDCSRNGRYLLFTSSEPEGASQVWALAIGAQLAHAIVETGHHDQNATFSPDGEWVAYQSDESGTDEVYVQPFKGLWGTTEGRRRISSRGGGFPRWRRDGAELFYVTPSGSLMSVTVGATENRTDFAPPRTLFQTRQSAGIWNSFDVSPDGQRFIMNLPLEDSASSPITILTGLLDSTKH
jgi:Tol biopolymer transport system component